MKIINDTIIFDDTDVALFSAAVQKGLQQLFGTNTDEFGNFIVPITVGLGRAANVPVVLAKQFLTKAQADNLNDLAAALALADPATKAQVQPILDQAAAIVGVTIKPIPLAQPPTLTQSSAQRTVVSLKA